MSDLRWNWLCAPYMACSILMLAVALTAALVRGDRVMRLGVIGAATAVLAWSFCSALAVCAQEAEAAVRLYRVGYGPVALIGPSLLLVLLGVAGQLERSRWLVRIVGMVGVIMLALCWATSLTIPGVQMLPSGVYYTTAGPLTDLQWSQLAICMAIGIYILRRSSTSGETRRISRLLIGLLALGGIGSIDMLIVHGVWSVYPIAWLPGLVAGVVAMYLVLRTDLLRPQGFDRNVLNEVIGFAGGAVVIGVLCYVLQDAAPLAAVVMASIVWVLVLAATWAVARQRPLRVAGSTSLEQFVSTLADVDDEQMIVQRLTALWKPTGVALRRAWRAEADVMVEITTGERWEIDREVIAWIVEHGNAVAPNDLATMRLGQIRPRLEAVVSTHGATLLVPLLDRGALLGLIEADHDDALRDDERVLVGESARAAARGLTYAALARVAAREGANEREVEVAEAMRRQAAASRDDELGRWSVAAEYRAAPKTTGAGWSATLLADGRLALMVTEAQADGVLAALATAALTGAFAAATTGDAPIELDDLLASLRASAEGVMRGGEPIAAFIAVLDADRQTLQWACAGHPGGYTVGPIANDLSQFPTGSGIARRPVSAALGGGGGALGAGQAPETRGEARLPHDSLLVVASTAVRGADEEGWTASLRDQAPAGPRLATVLVDAAQKRGGLHEDFLAVVIRQRPDRSSKPVVSFIR